MAESCYNRRAGESVWGHFFHTIPLQVVDDSSNGYSIVFITDK